MGFYLFIGGYSTRNRNKMSNVLPLTLDPHGSNMKDVKSPFTLSELDENMWLELDEKYRFVCAYAMFYLVDMPQQADNADVKTQRGNIFCRSCLISVLET